MDFFQALQYRYYNNMKMKSNKSDNNMEIDVIKRSSKYDKQQYKNASKSVTGKIINCQMDIMS